MFYFLINNQKLRYKQNCAFFLKYALNNLPVKFSKVLINFKDLVERLWDICDAKKEENEEERTSLMGNGWIEDHLCILTNLFVMLMQV